MLKFTETKPKTSQKPYVLWLSWENVDKINASFAEIGRVRLSRVDVSDGNITGYFRFPSLTEENGTFAVFTDCKTHAVFSSDSSHLKDIVKEECEKQQSFAGLLLSVLLRITASDAEYLLKTEKEIYGFEENLLENKHLGNNAKQISRYRKTLLKLKQHYESLDDVTDCLTAMSAKLSEEDNALLSAFEKRITRLVGKVADLREYVTEIREAYQSQVDINQNKLMKTFTVITAIFMPLQLITGWYGMNIIMPETRFEYAYPVLIAVCALIVGICLWIFKRNKYL